MTSTCYTAIKGAKKALDFYKLLSQNFKRKITQIPLSYLYPPQTISAKCYG